MKTILVLTDFSINADYAALYALQLAQKIEANLLVCNIYKVPANEATIQRDSWPMRASEENSVSDLGAVVAKLKSKLDKEDDKCFKPDIVQCSEEGLTGQNLKSIMAKHDVLLAVISAHSKNYTSYFGKDHAWDIIDNATFPVLVIPYQVRFKPFKMIAFATVLNYTDINILESISGLAKYSDAKILTTHVTVNKEENSSIKTFFNQIPFKITYPKILYHNIKGSDVVNSLKQLCAHIEIDLLVVVHRRRGFLQKLFSNSITRKITNLSTKPLLVFPCATVKETLTIF